MKLVMIVVAGIVGGVLIFMWGFVAHMQLGIGEMGVKPLTEQQSSAMMPVIRDNIKEPGFYFMPGGAGAENMNHLTQDQMNAYEEKYKAGASGIMVIAPIGEPAFANMPMRLVKELATDIGAALLGALVIFLGVPKSGIFRTIFLALMQGLMAWLLISTSYNIWFRFPREYIIGEGITEVAGFAIAGVGFYVVSLIFRKRGPKVKRDPLDVSSS
jgi:hypothetical protein